MQSDKPIRTVAIIGAGVVGRGWLPVFVRSGCETRVFDLDATRAKEAAEWAEAFLDRRVERDDRENVREQSRGELRVCGTLEEALAGAHYVQESIPENLLAKRALFAEMDKLTEPSVILASSTSTMDIEEIAAGLAHPERCVTAHPFNPAAILPAVEVLATRKAGSAFVDAVVQFLRRVGQEPVRLRKFATGYLGNRLQLALMREAFDIIDNGIAGVDEVDKILSEGLALRWAILGTFGTNHTNADHGIRSYYGTYGPTLTQLMDDLTTRSTVFDAEMIERFGRELDRRFDGIGVPALSAWRDDLIDRIQALKRSHPVTN